MDIAELKTRNIGELYDMAEELNLDQYSGLRKQDLLVKIESELLERGEALTAEGVLEILPEGYGFLRSEEWNYVYSPDDIYVSPSQIKRFNLRTGDTLQGEVRPPKGRERYLALTKLDTINGDEPGKARSRGEFEQLRPMYPEKRLDLEVQGEGGSIAMRVCDLIAPIGEGQRGLIVSPPKAGKTTIIREMAQSIAANHPDVHLIVLLIDERPEEVTEMRAKVDGEVVASTFDESAKRHVQVADMVLEKSKRLVEHGKDVVILLDSITRLARAYNNVVKHSGKLLSGGLDANALQNPKRFFGAARNIQDGGSLTIVATALIETGSRMDEVIFEEFKGTGNMELVLAREIAERRIFPAIDLNKSSTRKEELLLSDTELNRAFLLRNFLADMPPVEAIDFLLGQMRKTRSNAEFLDAMTRGGV
ncbi:MAG: transcription termination factor Rho [Longimicrobiales bacterium]|nr:transcription termination factor Rho [Longimicrobiales bacterium]